MPWRVARPPPWRSRWPGCSGVLLALGACDADGEERSEPGSPTTSDDPSAALVPTVPDAPPDDPFVGNGSFTIPLGDGRDGLVLLHAPPAIEERGRLPLVLAFHGFPGDAAGMAEMTRLDRLADSEGFLVAYPDSFVDPADVVALVDHLVDHWRVDPRRVHATGFSRGAAFVYTLAAEVPDRIASFAAVSGVKEDLLEARRPTALLTVQGGRDRLSRFFDVTNRSWAGDQRCARPTTERARLGGREARRTTAACRGGGEHVVWSVPSMSHVWPRGADALVWEFFAAHPLARRFTP
ncbi:PHB depolymerase family esterase [Nocardioides sp. TF02-7]|uniref:alpha/beta hydrolase family esterase n=1 Tax=Nocardioides sp. TF02-7 TaxID=2917724 RepID=UPI001F054F1E|nr:PHB depolymerase family esterase [Nocardioides sp. TF02-7]UMG94236.1 hypothetical protein MF408_09575 [Nocardioides sp. TF02-7]